MEPREQILLSVISGMTGATLARAMTKDGRSGLLTFSCVALVSAGIPVFADMISNAFSCKSPPSLSFEERLKQEKNERAASVNQITM